MAKYIVKSVTEKTTSTGKTMYASVLEAQDGSTTNVNLFDAVTVGQELEGELYQNDKGYTNFKKSASDVKRALTGNMTKAIEKKSEMIEQAQDRKFDGVMISGSIRCATDLVVALLQAGIIPAMASETEVKNKVREYIIWYRELYSNPSAVAPF